MVINFFLQKYTSKLVKYLKEFFIDIQVHCFEKVRGDRLLVNLNFFVKKSHVFFKSVCISNFLQN